MRAPPPWPRPVLGLLAAAICAVLGGAPLAAANQPPSLSSLDGHPVSVPPGGEVQLNLSAYLVDADDVFSNFTFAVAWDDGTVVRADVANGTLEIHSLTAVAAHARVTVVATDSAGQSAAATVEVDLQGAPLSQEGIAALLVVVLVGLGVGWLFLRAYRRRPRGAQGEGPSDEGPQVKLPAPALLSAGPSPAASSLFLLHRDGTVLAWARAGAPTAAETERAQSLAAVLAEAALRTRAGEEVKGETIDYGGSRVVFEGRSPLFLGALIAPGADEAALRGRMREAIGAVAQQNAAALVEGAAGGDRLEGVEAVLRRVLAGRESSGGAE